MANRFDIFPVQRFGGPSAAIRRPKEIACFSYDDKHQYHPDESSIRYYYTPPIGADLSKGFESFQKMDDTADEHLDSLLKTIMLQEQKDGKKVDANLITWRGMMTKIMATPFTDRDGFEMNATLFQGTIFLEENHDYKLQSWSKQRKQVSQPGRPSQDMMSYWGYKFETLSLIPATWDETTRDYIENRENEIVNNYAQYCSVVRTGIGSTTMILGGEVDAVWDTKPPPPTTGINWVELKTSQTVRSDRDAMNLERKLLKFWIQSFLLGVPKIIIGFRSPNGILETIQEMETSGIPGNVKRNGKGSWDGNICIGFTAGFLEWLKGVIREDGGVWRVRRRERGGEIEVFRVGEGDGGIITKEFREWREKLASSDGAVVSIGEAEKAPANGVPHM